jgi:hypothetical protein
MSLNDLWDRAFWGLLISIFVGLVWLKFLDPIIPCVWPGVVVSVAVGSAYVSFAVRKLRQAQKP